jgi:hypothetical protein
MVSVQLETRVRLLYLDSVDIGPAFPEIVGRPVTEVGDMGWLSFIRDPTGAALGLWKSKSK